MKTTTQSSLLNMSTKVRAFLVAQLTGLAATALLSVVSAQSIAAAAVPTTTDTLKSLVDARQFEQAYSLGSAAQLELEGSPSFDYYFGIAALESGHNYEATFALERAAIARPDQSRIRLELARAFFLSNDFDAARAQFQTVLAENPPEEVKANVRSYMQRMDAVERGQGAHTQFYVEAASGHDDNINSATGAGAINTPFGTFNLSENGQAQRDEYASLGGGAAYVHPFDKVSYVDVSGAATFRANFNNQQFNLGTLRLESGYGKNYERDRWRVGVRAQVVTLDKSRFQDAYGVIGNYGRDFGGGWAGNFTAGATTLRFNGDSVRDTDQFLGAATLTKQLGQFVNSLTAYAADELARDDQLGKHNSHVFGGAAYGIQWQLSPDWSPFAALSYQSTRYGHKHPVFAVKRDDKQGAVRVGVLWNLMQRYLVHVEYRYTKVDSNIDVFKYDRSEFEAGLRVAF